MPEKSQNNAAQYIGLLSKDFRHYCDRALEPFELTSGLYFYLIYIHYNSGCSLVDLKEGLRADKAYVTRMVTKLCQLGYVVKEKRREDGRSLCLSVTEKGEAVWEEIKGLPWEWNRLMLSPLADGEKELLSDLLGRACMGLNLLGHGEDICGK